MSCWIICPDKFNLSVFLKSPRSALDDIIRNPLINSGFRKKLLVLNNFV